MPDDEPARNPGDPPDEADEFERSPLPPPEPRRNLRRYQLRPRPRHPRRWRFWTIPAAVAIILTLLLVITGSAIANTQSLQISAALWLRVPLPATDGRAVHTIAPSPTDPNTLYACVGPDLGSAYPSPTGPAWVFRTRDAGAHWDVLPTPPLRASWCSVQVSPGVPGRITVAVHDGTQYFSGAPACAEMTTYLSDDGGETWQTLPPIPLSPASAQNAYCFMWGVGHSLLAQISYDLKQPTPAAWHTLIERSDDGGRTWQRADLGLPEGTFILRFLISGPYVRNDAMDDTMVVALVRYEIPSGGRASTWEIWRTDDAGRTWRYVNAVSLRPGSAGQPPAAQEPAIQPLYLVLGDQPPSMLFYTQVWQIKSVGRETTAVPPLPVANAKQDRAGILQVLGPMADGRLFVLGVDPRQGVPPTPDSNGASPSYQALRKALDVQWVWIWDPRIVRWEVVMSPLNVAEHAHYGCGNCWQTQLTRGSERDVLQQEVVGQYVWLRNWEGTESAAYRIFVPDIPA